MIALDDVHLLTDPTTHAALAELVEVVPANAQIAMASRTEPPLPLGRMRTNRALLEVGVADLAMTRDESAMMLRGAGLELGEPELAALHERTEGWPAGLYLAALGIADEADPAAAAAGFAGDDRLVVDYLRDELLAGLSPSQAKFLIRCSVLDELSGPVCDAALGRTGSARLLQQLSRSNALIVPLDRKDERYRLHHLLAEMLRSELAHREPDVAHEVHIRASDWYAEAGDLDRAVSHAIAGGDWQSAGDLIWIAFPELSGRGRLATLDRWLAQIGESRIAASAPLALATAHRHINLGDGDTAAHWARIATAAAGANGAPADELQADLNLINAVLAREGVVRMGEDCERAAELLGADSVWLAPCNLFRGVSVHLTGHPDRATPLLQEAVRRGAVGSPVVQVLALSQLALIATEDGRNDSAVRLIAQAHEQVVRCDLFEYPSMALVFATAAQVFAAAGRVDSARDNLLHARRLTAESTSMPPWYQVEIRIVLSRAGLRADELDAATEMLAEADAALAELDDAPLLSAWSRQTHAALDDAGERRSAYGLTRAELRTLQYLPTHLSFREIGERLFLSANTVKTQARAVYRKLDATSRAETVQRAREAGLLSGAGDDAAVLPG